MMYGWIIGLVLLVLIIWIAGRQDWTGFNRRERNKSPMEILEDRFARGEISEEEFEEQKKLLRK